MDDIVDCPLCDDDGDQRVATESREGVALCFLHALAYDLDTSDARRRVREQTGGADE